MENAKSPSKTLWLVLVLFLVAAAAIVFYYYYAVANTTSETGLTTTSSKKTATSREKVTIGVLGDVTGLYPEGEDETVTFEVNRSMFDALVNLNSKMAVVPSLALSWTNPDNTTWRFKLRSGVKFHDGADFTADDVKFSIDQIIKNEWWPIDYLGGVDSVTVVDPLTVDIKTTTADPILANKLANVLILSKTYKKGQTPNGTGPYKYVEYVKDDHTTLEANTAYFGGVAKTKSAIYKVITDEQAGIDQLKAGQVDTVQFGIEKDYTADLSAVSTVKVKAIDSLGSNLLFINTLKKDSPLANLKVRQAIYAALDAKTLTKTLVAADQTNFPTQIVTKDVFGYNDSIKRPSFNLTTAKQLLAESGIASPAVTLSVVKGTSDAFDNAFVENLKAAGFNAKVEFLEKEAWLEKMGKGELELSHVTWIAATGDAGETLATLVHTPDEAGAYGAYNAGYSNAALDKIIEQASQTYDKRERKTLLGQALKLVADDVAVIPLYQIYDRFGVEKKLFWNPRLDSLVFPYEMGNVQ